jgi:FKBP-type peptidyl-prolyl cis-trans isomerase (trigger factor)
MFRQGLQQEEVAARMPSLEEEIRAGSEAEIKRFFLLKEVAKKERIFVTEEEIQRTIQAMASMEKISPGEMRAGLEKNDRLGELRMELVEAKVMDHLRQHAKLVEKE